MIAKETEMQRSLQQERKGERGVTLTEILIIVGILGVILLVAIPLTSAQLKRANAQASVNEFSMALRAARVLAVTRQTPQTVTVQADPVNRYSFTDGRGRVRDIELPAAVEISASDSTITFLRNGSVSGGSSTTIDTDLPGGVTETYTITTSNIGSIEISKVRN